MCWEHVSSVNMRASACAHTFLDAPADLPETYWVRGLCIFAHVRTHAHHCTTQEPGTRQNRQICRFIKERGAHNKQAGPGGVGEYMYACMYVYVYAYAYNSAWAGWGSTMYEIVRARALELRRTHPGRVPVRAAHARALPVLSQRHLQPAQARLYDFTRLPIIILHAPAIPVFAQCPVW